LACCDPSMLTHGRVYKSEKESKEMETKYELVKELTGKAIAESACPGEFEKFVKHCGFHTKVIWDLEFEKYAMEQNEWVEFLVDKGFLVKREVELQFDDKKVYMAQYDEYVCMICKHTNDDLFTLAYIGKESGRSSTVMKDSTAQPPIKGFGKYVKEIEKQGYKVKEFDSLLDAMTNYHIDGL